MSDLNTKKTDAAKVKLQKKPYGCAIYFFIFLCIWLAGAWGLWHFSKDRPVQNEKSEGSSLFFEIIPGSDERSSVEDNMEDRIRKRQDFSQDNTE